MRILMPVQQWFPDRTGGAARVARASAVGLAARGHKVVVLAPRSAGAPKRSTDSGVEVRRVIRRSVLPVTATDSLEIVRAIRSSRDEAFDVVLGHGPTSVVGASAALPHTPVVYVFQASGVLEERFRRNAGLPLTERIRSHLVHPLLYWVEHVAARRASHVVVMSSYSRDIVVATQQIRESEVSVVWGGVDTDEFTPAIERTSLRRHLGIDTDQVVLLTVRRLVSRMGIDLLLAATSRLLADHPSLRLVVVGDGELRRHLEDESRRRNLGNHVHFAGLVSELVLKQWYQAADLFVLPTVVYEGFGMVTAEALACGTPVIGTRIGATTELLEPLDISLLATEPTAGAIGEVIDQTIGKLGSDLREKCRGYAVRNLSWDSALDRWEAALRNVVESAS